MFKKYLILIGRTFIAAFILVNLFNIIPINYSNNSWYFKVSMLLVDTSSVLLLGLASLKLASFLSINKESEVEKIQQNQQLNQKFKKNINVINRFSLFSMYLFIFVALMQFFIVLNGFSQLDILYSEKVLRYEKQYKVDQKKLESESNINLENNSNKVASSNQKDRLFEVLTKQKNSAISYLVRDALKVFLMSLVWAYGYFKLFKFS